jgi:hypothetical protein
MIARGKIETSTVGRAMSKKNKRTITGTHFVEKRPIRALKCDAPTYPIPEGRKYIGRMAWNYLPGVRFGVTSEQVATMFRESALPDSVFFLDTCFLRAPLDDQIWKALLTKQVVIPRLVGDELADWMASPGHSQANAAIVQGRLAEGGDRLIRTFEIEEYRRHAYEYYCPLLLLRKLKGKQWVIEFEQIRGRRPTKDEFFPEFKKLGKGYDDRAARIAWKGACDYERKNYAADEQTVTMAVLHALMTGRETTILTRDHDLMDQFYKLIFLIDTHYRSMLFAAKYAASPHEFTPQSKRMICEGHPNIFDDRFAGDDDVFMRPNLPDDSLWESLLPAVSDWVNIGCIWFGDGPELLQTAEMTFCADKGMVQVLRTKADTKGLNTTLLEGKNCHIWPCPELQRTLGQCVAIVTDKLIDYHPSMPSYRVLDMIHAMRSDEGFDTVEVAGAEDWFPLGHAPAEVNYEALTKPISVLDAEGQGWHSHPERGLQNEKLD